MIHDLWLRFISAVVFVVLGPVVVVAIVVDRCHSVRCYDLVAHQWSDGSQDVSFVIVVVVTFSVCLLRWWRCENDERQFR